MSPKEIPWEGVTSEAGAFNEQKTKSKKKANQIKKILCVYP